MRLSGHEIGDVPVSYSFLGFGEEVTTNTVNKMKDIIKQSAKNIRVRDKAAEIVSGLKSKDQIGEVQAIYNWTRDHTRYLKDPQGTEMIHSPLTALDQIEAGMLFQEDCDGLTVFILSLLKSIGYPVALRIASYKPDGKFSHVYGLVSVMGKWIPVEPIVWDHPLGWEKEGAYKVRDYKIENNGLFSGLSDFGISMAPGTDLSQIWEKGIQEQNKPKWYEFTNTQINWIMGGGIVVLGIPLVVKFLNRKGGKQNARSR